LDFVKSPGPAFASPNSGLRQQQGPAPSLAPDIIAVLNAAAAKLPPSRLPPGLEMPPGLEGCATGLEDPPLPVRRTRCQTPPPTLARSNVMATSPCPAQHTSPHCGPFDQSSPCGQLLASPWRSPGAQQATSSNFFSTTPVPPQSFSPVPPASWGAGPIAPVPPPPPTWDAGAGSPPQLPWSTSAMERRTGLPSPASTDVGRRVHLAVERPSRTANLSATSSTRASLPGGPLSRHRLAERRRVRGAVRPSCEAFEGVHRERGS
jgi:hypothetical protein